jgi:Icc-related predicted phosphoesterase
VKILLVSDVHGDRARVRRLKSVERDVTVVAGDLADCDGSIEDALEVLDELASHGPPVIWVPGNCDSPSLAETPPPRNTLRVHASHVLLEGIVYVGAGGGTYSPFSTPFEISDDELKELLRQGLEGLESSAEAVVMVTHVPAYASGLDRTWSGEYVGSMSVRSIVEERKPVLHVCGHIHEAWGSTVVGSTLSVNPGPLSQGRYALALLDVGRRGVVVRHHTV